MNFRDGSRKAKFDEKWVRIISRAKFDEFTSDQLRLGDITAHPEKVSVVAAVFDLQGFTNFCSQTDPHQSVPVFLKHFLKWLIEEIRALSEEGMLKDDIRLKHPLPFYMKFLGDGVLVLWQTDDVGARALRSIILSCLSICNTYFESFRPKFSISMGRVPERLRCGVAKGEITSVGENDFVGSCINIAARFQKLRGLRFAFDPRGFETSKESTDAFTSKFILRRCEVRGIGNDERVGILIDDFDAMKPDLKARYPKP